MKKTGLYLAITLGLFLTIILGFFLREERMNEKEVMEQAVGREEMEREGEKGEGQDLDQRNADNQNLEEFSFCDKIFKTEVITIGDINIVNKIAQIATKNPENKICENIFLNSPSGKFSSTIEKQKNTDSDYKDGVYFVNISILRFKVDMIENSIYILGAFDGKSTFIGNLR